MAATTTLARSLVTGFAVKHTPEARARTSSCTTTAISADTATLLAKRYDTLRSRNCDAQHVRTASSTASLPETPRIVSNCPAADAVPESSPRAEERTATTLDVPSTRSYMAVIDSATFGGIGVDT